MVSLRSCLERIGITPEKAGEVFFVHVWFAYTAEKLPLFELPSPTTIVVPGRGVAGMVAEYITVAVKWYFATSAGTKLTCRFRLDAPGARVVETVRRVTKAPVSRKTSIVTVRDVVNVVGLFTSAVKVWVVPADMWWVHLTLPRMNAGLGSTVTA